MPTSWSAMYGIVARMPVTATASDRPLRAEPAAHEVGRGDVAVLVATPTTGGGRKVKISG